MGKVVVLRTRGPEDTRAAAAALAPALRAGDVVALTGELGAGKTCFVQGAARALGVTDPVTSPSFLLRRDYRGDVPILHIDVYRLDTLQEVVDIGFDEVEDRGAIAFVEWGDAMSQLLPPDHLEVELRLGPVDEVAEDIAEERTISLRAHGDDWRRRLADASAALQPWRVDGGAEAGPC